MDAIKKLLEEQKTLIEQTFGDFSEKFKSLDTRLTTLEGRVKSRAVSLPGVEDEKEQFSFAKAIYAIRTGDWSIAPFEKAVFEETRKKAMSTGTDSAGGYIVPTQYITDLIEMLRAESIVMALGATVLDNLTGSPVEIPKQTGGATAYWVGENAAITASDLTLGQLSMSPKAVAALVKMSARLANLSNPSAEAMVRRDIAQALALAIDLAALRGSGTGGQPTGIANTAGINTVAIGTDGGDFTFETAADMVGTLEDSNALRGPLGYAMNPKVSKKLKKTRIPQFSGDTGGDFVMLPMSNENLADALGYDFKTSTQIPTNLTKGTGTNLSEVYFGNWQELIIAEWGGLELMASNETSDAFEKNQIWVRAIQEVDIAVRHPESFCLVNDATT